MPASSSLPPPPPAPSSAWDRNAASCLMAASRMIFSVDASCLPSGGVRVTFGVDVLGALGLEALGAAAEAEASLRALDGRAEEEDEALGMMQEGSVGKDEGLGQKDEDKLLASPV